MTETPGAQSTNGDRSDDRPRTDPRYRTAEPDADEIDLAQVAAVLRRRWWVVALVAVLAVAAALGIEVWRGNHYTATTLIEYREQKSPLDELAGQMGASGISSDVMASQVEITKSEGVLGSVVDTLGLQVTSPDGYGAVHRLFAEVRASPTAVHAEYEVAPGDGGAFVLRALDPDTVLSRASAGGWLTGPGFRLRLAPRAHLDEPLRLTVLYREEAVDALGRSLGIQEVGQTSLIRASYTARDPRMAAAIVNTLAASYKAHATAMAREKARRRRDFIATQLKQISDSLKQAQQTQLEYQEASGTVDPQEEGQALITALMTAEQNLQQLQYEQGVLAALSASLQKNGDVEGALRQAVALGDALPGVDDLYKRLLDAKAQRDQLTASKYGYTASGPEVQVTDSILASTKREIKALADQSLNVVRDKRSAARHQVDTLQAQIRNLPSRSARFARFQQQTQAIQSTYDLLASKYYEAQIDEAVEGGGVNIVDAGLVPQMPDRKHTARNLVLALILGLMLGTGGAFITEYFDSSVRDPLDAETAARLQLLGVVPHLPSSRNGSEIRVVAADTEGGGAGEEAFKAVRTMIRFARTSRPKVLAVTSAEPGEGKTSVAVNLAVAMAQEGARVLLVDADLRKPTVHRTFHLPRTPGLTDALVGETTVKAAAQVVERSGLHVLTCGTGAPNPAELLSSDALAHLIDTVRADYDTIILDTPPVLAVTDPVVLARAVDGMVVVARAGRTDRQGLGHATETLRHVGAPLLGIVVNDLAAGSAYGRSYYYYHHDYGSTSENGGGAVKRLFGRVSAR